MLSHIAGAFPPTDVRAVQDGPTSIRVTWTPPSPLRDTTGYRISFSGEGSSDSVSVNGESSYIILANLESGEIYNISIIATSSHLPSESVMTAPVALGKSLYVVYTPCCNHTGCAQFTHLNCGETGVSKQRVVSVPQYHSLLHFLTQLQQQLPLISPSLAVFPVALR